MPATIVGSANGRSMSALTARLPGNSSRTSTQAISVPTTTLSATTSNANAKVRRSAASACGMVAARQKAPQPALPERQTTAVSGRTTIRLRYMATVPRSSAAPPCTSSPTRRLVTALAAKRHAHLALDVGDDAVVLVEEPPVHLRPAAEVGDGEQPGRLGERGAGGHLLVDRPVALLGEDLLALRRQHEVDERPGRGGVPAPADDRDRVLDQDGLVGHDVVDRLLLLLGGDRLVLVGEHHVALAADEGLQRLAGRLVLHRHVAEQLLQPGDRLLVALALLQLGAVGGHDVPLLPAEVNGFGSMT